MKEIFKNIISKKLTIWKRVFDFSKTREVLTIPIREVNTSKKPAADSLSCPYCYSRNFQRRGFRQKKLEKIQLYLCLNCHKTFTPQITKGKHYPLSVMLDAISIYNLGYSLEKTCRIVNQRDTLSKDLTISATTLSNWIAETEPLCRYCQMRPYIIQKYAPKDTVIHATLAHRQLYRYRFHRGKCELLINHEYRHRRFNPLQEFLEMIPGECPHQYFQEGSRASETPLIFSKTAMIVRAKENYATRLCAFVLQSVKERKNRHEALQKFMLANDSVTVATEVPVYITKDDLEHMKTQLGFEIYTKSAGTDSTTAVGNIVAGMPKLITGHIDILQIRNGMIHILDYKPRAEKERPIEQLTLYAMALSRLTGLRLFEFKCAWFDEKDYFEFYPLHVLHKPKKARRKRKVETKEGVYLVNKNERKIEKIGPVEGTGYHKIMAISGAGR